VVPIRSGLGVISGFSETVCGILLHLGFDAAVTTHSDVAGFADAVDAGAAVIMAADDDRFVAFCPRQGQTVDNSRATARGYVAGLDLMAGGLAGRTVLVIGCGPVGRWSVEALLARRATICVVDRVPEKARTLARWARAAFQSTITVLPDAEQALSTRSLVVDATNAADVIGARHITADTRIAAPGMPCGIARPARERLAGRILHDPLQIGVAAMACDAVRIVCDQAAGMHSTDPDGGAA
jgi:pyrrolysine biosynthesis protein PylD